MPRPRRWLRPSRARNRDLAESLTLADVLERSRAVGFLGPGPVTPHIEHAAQFGRALGSAGGRFADLGAGGGVPGLPLLVQHPELSAVMIDASQKRCSFLVWAIGELGLGDRAEVWCGRAEEVARQERARDRFDAVVARGFGPPAVTVECAAPLLVSGGRLVISEPPVPRSWPVKPLSELGLVQLDGHDRVAVFERRGAVPDRFPRSAKRLQRDPLFELA